MIRLPRLALVVLLLSAPVMATKPCPEDPCRGDAATCAELAAWIVVGRVVALEHHPNPPPVGKDFVNFVVAVDKWDKGAGKARRLRFQVGWCNNRMPPPDKLGARVRIFGSGSADAAEPQYLGLEALP